VIRPDMRDHVLALAARYNDAAAEEHGIEEAVKAMGLELADVFYLAEQRAIRVLGVVFPERFGHLLGNHPTSAVLPWLRDKEQVVFDAAKIAVLDGVCIGYKAKTIKEADDGNVS
jgi:hypothetical protein